MTMTYTDDQNRWEFSNRRGTHENTGPCYLVWELRGDPITDNFTPAEISADELLRIWAERYYPDQLAEHLYGPGMVGIS